MSAEEILKRRSMAAKGLKPTPADKPIDPMEDPVGEMDEMIDPPRDPDEPHEKIAAGAVAGLAVRRSG